MARKPISITLEESLITQIDQFAKDIGVTRTSIIEQCIQNELPRQEENYRILENPLVRSMHEKVTSPAVLRLLAKLAQSDMSDEEIESIIEKGPRQREAAKKMGERRKQVKKSSKGKQS
ncbi:MAG: hypothetical protein ACWA5W_10230 [Phycisphaerales bacterium]